MGQNKCEARRVPSQGHNQCHIIAQTVDRHDPRPSRLKIRLAMGRSTASRELFITLPRLSRLSRLSHSSKRTLAIYTHRQKSTTINYCSSFPGARGSDFWRGLEPRNRQDEGFPQDGEKTGKTDGVPGKRRGPMFWDDC